MVSSAASQQSILVLTPIGRDAELACQVLEEAGLAGERCEGLGDLCRKLDEGAGAVLLAEEALADATLDRLVQMLDEQPPWSTLPVLVLTRDKSAFSENVAALKTLETRRGVTFLERPLRIMTLISTVQATLEARRRQYQIRDLLQTAEEGMRYRQMLAITSTAARCMMRPSASQGARPIWTAGPGSRRSRARCFLQKGGDPLSSPSSPSSLARASGRRIGR